MKSRKDLRPISLSSSPEPSAVSGTHAGNGFRFPGPKEVASHQLIRGRGPSPSSQRLLSADIPHRPPEKQHQRIESKEHSAKNQQVSFPKPKLSSTTSHQARSSRPTFEIVIPPVHDILKGWAGRPPKSAAILKVERKALSKAALKAGRNALLKELKKSTTVATKKEYEIALYFSKTGFSNQFSIKEDLDRLRKSASKKKKKVIRQNLDLDVDFTLPESLGSLSLNEKIVHPAQAAKRILINRFDERISPPLTFANDINERRLHGKFQFTNQYIIQQGVRKAPPTTDFGCGCTDCRFETCLCFRKHVENDTGKGRHPEQIRTYVRRPDGIVVLSDEYLARELDPLAKHFEISECNECCACGPDCWNRVVSKGRTVPLEVFQTAKCGFGVRSSVDIVKGQFIELYLGEVITEKELLQREEAAEENESSYVYSLDWFDGADQYHIDGAYFGTPMRFVNHSCNPNARCFPVQIHKADKKVYYLAFFAIRHIQAREEIRIDYSGEREEMDEDSATHGELAEGLVRCFCGEKNCRKVLWTPGVKVARRKRKPD